MRVLAVALVVMACKSSSDPAPAPAAAQPPSTPIDAAAATPTVPAPHLVFVKDTSQQGLSVPFDGNIPRLPASTTDGSLIADVESDAMGPMIVWPATLVIRSLDGAREPERLVIVDDDQAQVISQNPDDWTTNAAMVKTMHDRVAKVLARLRDGGFSTLTELETAADGSAKLGDLAIATTEIDSELPALSIALTNSHAEVVRRDIVVGYDSGTFNSGMPEPAPCRYRPVHRASYADLAKQHVFVGVSFKWHEECEQPSPLYLSFDVAAAKAAHADLDAIRAVVRAHDAYTADAQIATPTGIATSDHAPPAPPGNDLVVTLSRDGKTAWTSSAAPELRVSDVVVKTPQGWRIAVSARSRGVADATVNAEAKAGKRPIDPSTPPAGDATVREQLGRMISAGIDDVAAARPDLVAIGSAPGEHTLGGKILAAGWAAAWKGKVKIQSEVTRLAPSGNTGWAIAKVSLAKPGYVVPFLLFVVFDKQADGTWGLVHAHFAI